MGTAGLLSTYLNYALSKGKVSGIDPNWEQIKRVIYGKEIEPDTYQLAVTNIKKVMELRFLENHSEYLLVYDCVE